MPSIPFASFMDRRHQPCVPDGLRTTLLVATIIGLAALAGVYSRPTGFLATFWPANALLAGLLVRARARRRLPILIGAFVGLQIAGTIAGDQVWIGLQMTVANLLSAVTLAFIFCLLDKQERDLTHPRAVVALIGAAAIAAVVSGMLGGWALVTLTGGAYFAAWRTWLASELMSYLVLLPGMLATPWPLPRLRFPGWAALFRHPILAPAAALAASVGIGLLISHPVAIVFPVPALIWCALLVPLPLTCLLVLIYSGATMFAIKLGFYDLGRGGLNDQLITAVHLGIAMIALGPVLVASATGDRRRQIEELKRAATYDALTDALNRGSFLKEAERVLVDLRRNGEAVAIVVIDVDHFKQVNDVHGHAAGDMALVALSAAVKKSIRSRDLFGRLGGEEFALLLPAAGLEEARTVANRLRLYVERLQTTLPSGDVLKLTVSVGVAVSSAAGTDMSELLSFADQTMYEAKRAGRNRVECTLLPA